jgi:hypothetical protein
MLLTQHHLPILLMFRSAEQILSSIEAVIYFFFDGQKMEAMFFVKVDSLLLHATYMFSQLRRNN